MAEPFLGEIKMFSFDFAPKGWSDCNGQIIPVNENQSLFSLLGTMYGGNGQTTFGLPDFRGRVPFHVGNSYSQGMSQGLEVVTLTVDQLPAHKHSIPCDTNAATESSPSGNVMAVALAGGTPVNKYNASSDNHHMAPTLNAGNGISHQNMPPFLAVRFCISLVGIYPSRN